MASLEPFSQAVEEALEERRMALMLSNVWRIVGTGYPLILRNARNADSIESQGSRFLFDRLSER